MKKKRKIWQLALFIPLLISPFLGGAVEYGDFKVIISLDKQLYYADEEIILKIHVRNSTLEKKTLVIYDKDDAEHVNYSTFQPIVFDMGGTEAEAIVPYRREAVKPEDELAKLTPRQVTLLPGETLTHRVNLLDLYTILEKTRYRVKGYFSPDCREKLIIASENELTFSRSAQRSDALPSGMTPLRQGREYARAITPAEIVRLALMAEKDRDTSRLIKYFDIAKYINAYQQYANKYNRAEEDDRAKIEEEFLSYLCRPRSDYLLDFTVVSEDINSRTNSAVVDLLVNRYGGEAPERYRYRYTLEKSDTSWLIVYLEVTVLRSN